MPVVIKTIAQITVAASGTEVAVSATTLPAVKLWVSAPSGNTGSIFVGDTTNIATTRGIEVIKGTTAIIEAPGGDYFDLAAVWIDAATNGDKANITYLQKLGR